MSIHRSFLFALLPLTLLAACDGEGSSGNTAGDGGTAGSTTNGGTAGSTTNGGGGAGGSTTNGGGGAGGSTMTGGTGGMAAGACINAEDGAVLSDPSKDIEKDVSTCAQMNFGMEPATYDCIKMLGLTDGCAQCFDDTVQCIFTNCLQQCAADPASQACADCRAQFCDGPFAECSGLTP